MKLSYIKIEDCFEIPLSDGRYAYGRYLFWDENYGPLCEIFSTISSEPVHLAKLDTSTRLFPPIYIGFGSIFKKVYKEQKWRVIGNLPAARLQFPHFRQSFATKPGKYTNWTIYDGTKTTAIGCLKPGMEKLEILCAWSPQLAVVRIQTGENRYDSIL